MKYKNRFYLSCACDWIKTT